MRTCLLALVAVSAAACDKGRPAAGRANVSTAEVDTLWALAPAGTELGLVASPRGLALLDGAKTRMLETLRSAPELASLARQVESGLASELGTSDFTVTAHGLALDKGFALFANKNGRVLVLPVANRDKFLASAKGAKGTDTDTVGNLTCKTVKGVYACATSTSLLDGLGAKGLPDGVKLAGARGDIEVAGAMPGPAGPIAFAIVGQLDRGAIVARIAVHGLKSVMPVRLAEGVAPRVDAGHTTGFAVVDFSTWLAAVPSMPVVPGVTADELARTIAGPFTATMLAGNTFDMRLPLSDVGPAKKLIEQCDQLPPLRGFGATVDDDGCHVPIPQMMMQADAWIEGKELRIGKRGAGSAAGSAELSPIGTELAAHKWPLVFWGRGSILSMSQLPPMPAGDMPDITAAMVRVFTLLNELGMGMRMEGDTMHAVFSARTAYANPDAVIAKLATLKPEDFVAGRAAGTAKDIAASAPGSAFATDFAAGHVGLMAPTAALGMIASVAIPAFMQYMKRSKSSESTLHLNRLAKYLRAAYAANSALPIGTAPLTPATPCCDGPDHKCGDPAAWATQPVWKELEFSIDEPHLFRYDYTSTDGKSFVAHAVADLDCDGEVVTYTLTGAPEGDMLKVHMSGPEGTD